MRQTNQILDSILLPRKIDWEAHGKQILKRVRRPPCFPAANEPTMKRNRAELWRTAIHEAGHAVVARVLGLDSGLPTIVPNFDLEEAGHHINRSPWKTLYEWEKRGLLHRTVRRAVRGCIMMCMAGAE